MVKVIIVNGRPGSGKTTFEEMCQKLRPDHVHIISTVTFVKEVAQFCGWDKTKTPKNRKFLSDLKYLLADWEDVPYQKVREEINKWNEDQDAHILFVDSREPAEIARFKKDYGAITVLIRRKGDEAQQTSNSADAEVFNYSYDLIIENFYDKIFLEKKAQDFLNKFEGE